MFGKRSVRSLGHLVQSTMSQFVGTKNRLSNAIMDLVIMIFLVKTFGLIQTVAKPADFGMFNLILKENALNNSFHCNPWIFSSPKLSWNLSEKIHICILITFQTSKMKLCWKQFFLSSFILFWRRNEAHIFIFKGFSHTTSLYTKILSTYKLLRESLVEIYNCFIYNFE